MSDFLRLRTHFHTCEHTQILKWRRKRKRKHVPHFARHLFSVASLLKIASFIFSLFEKISARKSCANMKYLLRTRLYASIDDVVRNFALFTHFAKRRI